jgi:hypothetical protein
MHPRTEELLSFLQTSQIRLQEAVEAVPQAVRDRTSVDGRWTVAQVVEHLALTETGIARLIRKRVADARAAGLGPEAEISSVLWSLDVARVLDRGERIDAPERIRPAAVSFDDAWSRFLAAHADVRDAVAGTDGMAIGDISYPHPSMGTLNLYQWIIFVGAHEMRHSAQIREAGRA